jgi:hypothetical protein
MSPLHLKLPNTSSSTVHAPHHHQHYIAILALTILRIRFLPKCHHSGSSANSRTANNAPVRTLPNPQSLNIQKARKPLAAHSPQRLVQDVPPLHPKPPPPRLSTRKSTLSFLFKSATRMTERAEISMTVHVSWDC